MQTKCSHLCKASSIVLDIHVLACCSSNYGTAEVHLLWLVPGTLRFVRGGLDKPVCMHPSLPGSVLQVVGDEGGPTTCPFPAF